MIDFIFTAKLFCFFIKQLNIMVIVKRVSLLAMEPCSRTFPVSSDGGRCRAALLLVGFIKSTFTGDNTKKTQKSTQTRQKVIKMRSEIGIERD